MPAPEVPSASTGPSLHHRSSSPVGQDSDILTGSAIRRQFRRLRWRRCHDRPRGKRQLYRRQRRRHDRRESRRGHRAGLCVDPLRAAGERGEPGPARQPPTCRATATASSTRSSATAATICSTGGGAADSHERRRSATTPISSTMPATRWSRTPAQGNERCFRIGQLRAVRRTWKPWCCKAAPTCRATATAW